MTKTTLKPCPFCGTQPNLSVANNGSYVTSDYCIDCPNEECGVRMGPWIGMGEARQDAVNAWNRRKP